ncbi:SDR family NAD(P)-dependent oxidoreductase [Glutamicibacter sp. NPDC127525]|uniref:SDR family NAD(P)-dependent oxidoreductase n=1 Tax=unclassified Glutamicibacter TaxID=2627139 RepID=UPI003640532C
MNQTENLEVVVITGGASGIGLECAKVAAARGARVAILDISQQAGEKALAVLPEPHLHLAIETDVTDRRKVEVAFETITDTLGSPTALVAAAGIVCQTPLKDVTEAEFRRVMSINVEGVHNSISAATKYLMRSSGSSVVVLGSVSANTGGGLMGSGVYATSKAAVIGMVRGYARELSEWGTRVNLVSPAATSTPMTQNLSESDQTRILSSSLIGRFIDPREIAETVNFLLTPGAGAITGQVIQANGGVYFN